MASFWHDKVAVITGGSAGLGLAIAQAYARAGARVVLAARDQEKLQAARQTITADPTRVVSFPCDVTQDDDVRHLVDAAISRFGRIDVWVNNVGRSMRGSALETSLTDYQALWELNFLAAVRCSQMAMPHLRAQRGHLVNIGSLSSKTASPFLGSYAASKFPLAAFSQQLRLELHDAVHVLLVCPGPIARGDAGRRYLPANDVPASANKPGGGVKLKGISPETLAERILQACEHRQAELVMPGKARLLFALAQLFPRLGDRIVAKMTK